MEGRANRRGTRQAWRQLEIRDTTEGLRGPRGATCERLQGAGAKSWSLSTDLGVWPPALQGAGGSRTEVPSPRPSPCPLPGFCLLLSLTFVPHCPAQPPASPAPHIPQAQSARTAPHPPPPVDSPLGTTSAPHPQRLSRVQDVCFTPKPALAPLWEPQIRFKHRALDVLQSWAWVSVPGSPRPGPGSPSIGPQSIGLRVWPWAPKPPSALLFPEPSPRPGWVQSWPRFSISISHPGAPVPGLRLCSSWSLSPLDSGPCPDPRTLLTRRVLLQAVPQVSTNSPHQT